MVCDSSPYWDGSVTLSLRHGVVSKYGLDLRLGIIRTYTMYLPIVTHERTTPLL